MSIGALHQDRWPVFILIVLAQLVLSLGSHSWGLLAPFLKETMRLSHAEVGSISSVFYLASAVSAFPAGLIVDRFGVKTGMLLWLCMTGLPLMIMETSSAHFPLFLGLLAFSGLGYGMGNPVASKGLYLAFQRGVRGTVFGFRQCTVTLGGALAGLWLVALSQKAGPFFSLRVVSSLIILMGVINLLIFPSQRTVRTRGAVHVERKGLLQQRLRGLFRSRVLLVMTVIGMALGFSQGVVGAFLVLFLSDGLGLSRMAAGGLFSVMMIGASGARLLWGLLSDRVFGGRRRPVLLLVSLLGTLSLLILIFWREGWPTCLLPLLVLTIGASTWGWNSIFFVIVTEVSDADHTATFLGFTTAFGWLGIASGPVVFGRMTETFGYDLGWMAVVACCALAGVLSFRISESRH